MLRVIQSSVVALSLVFVCGAQGAIRTFVLPLEGSQEVSGGDPNGTGTAFLTIDDATVPNPTISWNMVVNNLEPTISGVHIHVGAVGVNGGIVVPFTGNSLTGSGLQDPDLVAVLANPAGYYVNIHTMPSHGGGAIRGQMNRLTAVSSVSAYGLAALAVLLAASAVMVFKKRQPVLAS